MGGPEQADIDPLAVGTYYVRVTPRSRAYNFYDVNLSLE